VAFDLVAGIDALGFILGTALALRAGKGFIPIRKGGKLPVPAEMATFVDYSRTRKALELRHGAIRPGQRVLLVDEWIETGAQVTTASRLIEASGGMIVGVATIHVDANERTQPLRDRYPCYQVWPDA
jgi:adenine phosphoribosyltransferase